MGLVFCTRNRDFNIDDSRSDYRALSQLRTGLCNGEGMAMIIEAFSIEFQVDMITFKDRTLKN